MGDPHPAGWITGAAGCGRLSRPRPPWSTFASPAYNKFHGPGRLTFPSRLKGSLALATEPNPRDAVSVGVASSAVHANLAAAGYVLHAMSAIMTKTSSGNFFEDFRTGQVIRHATPRTVTVGDVALYCGLFGPRFAVQSSGRLRQGDRLSATRRSTISWCFTWCSARPCRISRSTRWRTSATRPASSSPRCSPATR